MRSLQIEVEVTADRHLNIELPDDLEVGKYQIVLLLNPQKTTKGRSPGAWKGLVKIADDFDAESQEIISMFYGELNTN